MQNKLPCVERALHSSQSFMLPRTWQPKVYWSRTACRTSSASFGIPKVIWQKLRVIAGEGANKNLVVIRQFWNLDIQGPEFLQMQAPKALKFSANSFDLLSRILCGLYDATIPHATLDRVSESCNKPAHLRFWERKEARESPKLTWAKRKRPSPGHPGTGQPQAFTRNFDLIAERKSVIFHLRELAKARNSASLRLPPNFPTKVLTGNQGRGKGHAFPTRISTSALTWVWVKIKPPGDRRF